MTPSDNNDHSLPDGYTEETFEAALTEVVAQARRAGLDIEGAYDVRSPRDTDPDYTVEITEITKPS